MNDTAIFLALTFGVSYGLAAAFHFSGMEYASGAGVAFATAYMFVPALCTVIVEKLIRRRQIRERLLVSFRPNWWFAVAWLGAPLIGIGALGVALLLPGVTFSPNMEGMFERFGDRMTPEQIEQMRGYLETLPVHPFWIMLGQGLIAGLTINAVAGFGEELGWRGFLVDAFGEMSFARASVVIGTIWGIWHAPLILMGHNYPEHSVLGVPMMTVWCVLLTPLFLYVTLKARSVIAAAILHGTLNGTAGLAVVMIEGGSDLSVGATGLAGFVSVALLVAVLFAYDRALGGGWMRGTLREALQRGVPAPGRSV